MKSISSKESLRRKFLQQRSSLSREDWENLSQKILNRFFELELWEKVKLLTCYVSFNNEVNTLPILREAIKQNKQVAVPRVNANKDGLSFYEIKDIERDLELGSFKILEPIPERTKQISPEIPELHIVPGIVFDKKGFRIGYGRGYYDKFLNTISQEAIKVALAFDFQVIDKIPVGVNDIPIDLIITDKKIIYPRK